MDSKELLWIVLGAVGLFFCFFVLCPLFGAYANIARLVIAAVAVIFTLKVTKVIS